MAYPFLPVNPCCTDVVINDPCGCSSTITNSGCNSNDPCSTNLTASSTIAYDGPALSCIIAEPCDTLNVILQKIDEIICNLLTQINILTIQVNNITTQIINIEGDIINIDNSLDACCNTTTSTTTTVAIPCQGFSLNNISVDPVAIIVVDCATGLQTAIILPPGNTNVCVQTGSPVSVPVTVVVTPTGPCTPSTTTTTTTLAINCTFTGTAQEVNATTTTTTTVALNCSFTGSSVQETTTTTTTAVPTTTTTSSSTSSTTTSTTTSEPTTTTTSSSTSTSTSTSTSSSTTTTTTTKLSCGNFELQGLTGGGSWTGLDCYTELFVGDSVPQGFSEFTGCIISSSLEITNLEIKGEIPCSTTTTTTTLLSACYIVEGIWEVDDPAHPAGGYVDYIDEFGNNQSLSGLWVIDSINIIASSIITSSGVTVTPSDCSTTTSTTTTAPPTTTTTTTTAPTTTTSTTCNAAETHDYPYQPIRGTNLIPDFISSLVDACSSQICLQNTTCSIDFSYLVYFNVPVPGIGDKCYSSTIGCIVGLVNDGYYIIDYSGTYTIVEIVNSTIVSLPLCPA